MRRRPERKPLPRRPLDPPTPPWYRHRVSKKKAESGAPDDMSFEDALGEVEAIIDRIESGKVGLEQSISEYERGAKLIKHCREVLQRAELRVQDLTGELMGSGGKGDSSPSPGGADETPARGAGGPAA